MTRRQLYLAGPDVFRPDARALASRKKALCRAHGFDGLDPLDNPLPQHVDKQDAAMTIFQANMALMGRADAIVANLTPFRGPSADPGTVFELAWILGQGRPAFGYSTSATPYSARTLAMFGGPDPSGDEIEDFGLHDNLMIDRALEQAGQPIVTPPRHDLDPLWGFERCLEAARRHFDALADAPLFTLD